MVHRDLHLAAERWGSPVLEQSLLQWLQISVLQQSSHLIRRLVMGLPHDWVPGPAFNGPEVHANHLGW